MRRSPTPVPQDRAGIGPSDQEWESFYGNYAPAVLILAKGKGLDDATARDIVQETMARAFQSRARYEERGQGAKAWLFRIATNLIISGFRKKPLSSIDTIPEVSREASHDGLDLSLDLEEALSPELREVVALRDLEGRTIAETAEVLGIPPGAVQSRLHRAHRRLRLVLSSSGSPTSSLPTDSSTRSTQLKELVLTEPEEIIGPALRGLCPVLQWFVQLRVYEGRSIPQVATTLAVTDNQVSTLENHVQRDLPGHLESAWAGRGPKPYGPEHPHPFEPTQGRKSKAPLCAKCCRTRQLGQHPS